MEAKSTLAVTLLDHIPRSIKHFHTCTAIQLLAAYTPVGEIIDVPLHLPAQGVGRLDEVATNIVALVLSVPVVLVTAGPADGQNRSAQRVLDRAGRCVDVRWIDQRRIAHRGRTSSVIVGIVGVELPRRGCRMIWIADILWNAVD